MRTVILARVMVVRGGTMMAREIVNPTVTTGCRSMGTVVARVVVITRRSTGGGMVDGGGSRGDMRFVSMKTTKVWLALAMIGLAIPGGLSIGITMGANAGKLIIGAVSGAI
jgi:hypothetical protein